jgi:hypothetical protein
MPKSSLRHHRHLPIGRAAGCALAALLLLLAACASGAEATDNDKTHGFYGGVNGGWSHP